MAKIEKRKNGEGFSYRVLIRRKCTEISRTFFNEEDAKLFAFYKERLIDNMEAFEVPINERITLKQIVELKINNSTELHPKSLLDFKNSYDHLSSFVDEDKFIHEFTYEEWLDIAKKLCFKEVYKGSKSESGKRIMSIGNLRRIFACISSAISHVQNQGINIKNHPMDVLKTFINPQLNNNQTPA